MSELEQLKEILISRIGQETSVEVLREFANHIESTQDPAFKVTPELLEKLRQAEEDIAAGRVYTSEEVRARMEARFGFSRKAG